MDDRLLEKIISAARIIASGELQDVLEYTKGVKINKDNYQSQYLKSQRFIDAQQNAFEDNFKSAQEARTVFEKELAKWKANDRRNLYVPLETAALEWAQKMEQASLNTFCANLVYRPMVQGYWDALDAGYKKGWAELAKEEDKQFGAMLIEKGMELNKAMGLDPDAVIKERKKAMLMKEMELAKLDEDYTAKSAEVNAARLRNAVRDFTLNNKGGPGRVETQNLIPGMGHEVAEKALALLIKRGQARLEKQGKKNVVILPDLGSLPENE